MTGFIQTIDWRVNGLNAWTNEGLPAGVLGSQLSKWLMASRGQDFSTRFNAANKHWWRLPIAVSWQADTGLYMVRDTPGDSGTQTVDERILIARRERVFRYRRGVANRIHRLAGKYFIDRMQFEPGDVVIDCGANVGEVGLYVRSRADVRVIAVEPSDTEASACDENVFGGQRHTQRCALWHAVGQQTFYDSNVTGDSSLIAPAANHAGVTDVQTTTLEQLVEEHEVDRIKLLKIEGEGAEPEILQGGEEILSRVAYCTVDCGPERGLSQAHVIPQVCNFLIEAGFELLDVNLERQIFWFRNRQAV